MRKFVINALVVSAFVTGIYILSGTAVVNEVNAQSLEIEEITVTARKRDETLADAPYTITALTANAVSYTHLTLPTKA